MKAFPSIFYGTAWKKQKTAELVQLALKSGFRAIDTACQPKHYNEAGVGQGIQKSGIPRDQIFIQTKFSPIGGQDLKTIPYNPKADIKTQVITSLQVSLKNLQTQYIDSLVLHSPMANLQKTLEVWRVFQQFIKEGRVHALGISNCYDPKFFKSLYEKASVKPTFIQNRFYSDTLYDVQIRQFCRQNKVHYQSFWTLSANPQILQSKQMKQLIQKYKQTAEQIFYMILIEEGIIPLIGTTSKKHMEQDLAMLTLKIQKEDKLLVLKLLK